MSDETPTGKRRWWVTAAAVASVLVAVGAVVAFRRPPPPPDGLVILYGDSLSTEAAGFFAHELDLTTRAQVVNRAVPGLSPCDALPSMREDLALEPTVVVIQYVGNNQSPCSRGPGGGHLTGQALADRTAADVAAATEMWAARGARVVLVGGPDSPGLPGAASNEIADAYNEIVNEWAGRDLGRVRYADAAATVTGPDHEFVRRLACREDEGRADGCRDGRVTVRSPDRVHFCPVAGPGPTCPVPSPGARRFGREMARVAAMALDPEG